MNGVVDPALLARWVLWGGLAIGLVFGAVGQATRFCVRGAIADWMVFRGPARAASWFLAIGVGAVLVQALVAAGWLDGTRTLGWSSRLLLVSSLVGGLLFGYGMVLCQGCPQRCLVKAGSGNLKAMVTLIIVSIAALMTLRGLFAGPRTWWLDAFSLTLAGPQDIGSAAGRALGVSANALRWTLSLLALGGAFAFAWRSRHALGRGNWIGGIVVGILVAAAFWLTGHIGFIAEHPETLEPAWLGTQSRRPEGLSFSAPMAHMLDLLTLWSDKATVPTFGVMVAVGVLLGSFASAKLRGDFKLESFSSPKELGEQAIGAVLMGFGGVTALGCSIGNGVTGLALLSMGAIVATLGITAGAWLALRRQIRQVDQGALVSA